MISLNNIKPNFGSRKTSKKLGRGNGSGKWTYSWRGMNGQNCRSGWWVPDWFEWGQTPLFRRMPKIKGFSNALFKKKYSLVNLSDLEKLAKSWFTSVNKEILIEKGFIKKKNLPVKLLWNWELSSTINVTVNKSSHSAKEALKKVWGKLELV